MNNEHKRQINAERQARFRATQLELGRKQRLFWITEYEYQDMKSYLDSLREVGDHCIVSDMPLHEIIDVLDDLSAEALYLNNSSDEKENSYRELRHKIRFDIRAFNEMFLTRDSDNLLKLHEFRVAEKLARELVDKHKRALELLKINSI